MSPAFDPQGDDDGPRRPTFRDRKGHRIDGDTYVSLRADPDYCRVARDTIGTRTLITVWHGYNPYAPDGQGWMFSSIVLREVAPGESVYGHEEWFNTEEEAIEGHARRVAALRELQS